MKIAVLQQDIHEKMFIVLAAADRLSAGINQNLHHELQLLSSRKGYPSAKLHSAICMTWVVII